MAIAPVDIEIGSDAPRGGGGKTVLPFVFPRSQKIGVLFLASMFLALLLITVAAITEGDS